MVSKTRTFHAGLTLMALVLVSGCVTTTGSRVVAPAGFDYNQAIARSWDEQLLLNLVRLRYRDTPVFLAVGSVTAQYSWSAGGSISTARPRGGGGSTGLGIGGDYSERPTISFAPLAGRDFVIQLLTPIPPVSLALLARSGWSIERLTRCCVHSIGDLLNAPSAAGPTPASAPEFAAFRKVSSTLRQLQRAGALDVRISEDEKVVLRFAAVEDPTLVDARQVLLAAVGHDAAPERAVELPIIEHGSQGGLVVTGRSLLATLYYLSQAVEPPSDHVAAGWVTSTRNADGTNFDWSALTADLIRIQSSRERPSNAFVAVDYRDTWFFIPDDDLESKTTFGLVTFLFSLQSTGGGPSPLLTLSAGS